jgi:3-methyladenine DNA glycosylase/8-oxoguanine DNA glycosylase
VPQAERVDEATTVRLPFRAPLFPDNLFGHLVATAVPGVEEWRDGAYRRTLRLPHGRAVVALRPRRDHVRCTLVLQDPRDQASAVARCRRLLDLDADPSPSTRGCLRTPCSRRWWRRRRAVGYPGPSTSTSWLCGSCSASRSAPPPRGHMPAGWSLRTASGSMRALGDADAFLATDLGVITRARAAGLPIGRGLLERAERWRPWRAYAVQHLWALGTTR